MIRRKTPFPIACAVLAAAYLAFSGGTTERPDGPGVIVLGLDGLDPDLLSSLMEEGALPNFSRLAREGSFSRLGTTTPPQSPVAWSTFLTGANPGVHGVFDFVHRDPTTYRPYLSTARTEAPECVLSFGDWRFPLDSPEVVLLRSGDAFWEKVAAAGHPVLALKVPADYPPGEEEGRILAGMGVPDLAGTYGDFTYYTDRPDRPGARMRDPGQVPRMRDPGQGQVEGGRIEIVHVTGGRVLAELPGPPNTLRAGSPALTVPVLVEIDPEEPAAHIQIGESRTVLVEGEWSPWLAASFDPGFLAPAVHGICRVHLVKVRPWFGLYVSPVNVDPRDPALPITRPEGFSGELAAELGPFYTQGMAEETSGLSSGVLSDASYLDQAGIVLSETERMLDSAMDDFGEQGGFLFFYVSTSDLTSHMFWRARDPGHPAPPPELPPGSDPIRDLYVRLDRMLGRIRERAGNDATLLVLSDHGFAPYRRSFDVNAWLASEGYLVLSPHAPPEGTAGAADIDWERTRAYGVGFNALYLNLRGREGRGIVEAADASELAREIRARLVALVDPATGGRVFRRVDLASEVYRGDRTHEAPDLVLGYERGYRTSAGSALLSVGRTILFDNAERWSGDHLMAAELVPGVLLSNRRIRADSTPALADLAPTVLAEFGLAGENLEGTDILER